MTITYKPMCRLLFVLFWAVLMLPDQAVAKTSKNKTAQQPEVAYSLPLYDEIQIADAQPISNDEMGELRAGFIDPTGLLFRFAVDVKSQIDGALMFVRSLVLETGARGHYTATASSQVMPENLPAGTTASVIDKGAGVVVSSDQGKTTLLNQPSSTSFASVIVNQADNRVVSQTVNIDLVLQNVQASMAQMSAIKNYHAPAGLFQSARMHTIGFGL